MKKGKLGRSFWVNAVDVACAFYVVADVVMSIGLAANTVAAIFTSFSSPSDIGGGIVFGIILFAIYLVVLSLPVGIAQLFLHLCDNIVAQCDMQKEILDELRKANSGNEAPVAAPSAEPTEIAAGTTTE